MDRADTTLGDGTKLTVELRGPKSSQASADLALSAARRRLEFANKAPFDETADGHAGIVGKAPPMHDLFRMMDRIKGSEATILISGENGTGKELVARAIHAESPRSTKRFVATNCSAFNDNLLESELFGHRKGAFTGAVVDKPGLFEVANGGTFFLDEVGDMSPALQVKLLRVLQDGSFLPVGSTDQRSVDVRIIAATNRDLTAMVASGRFREDLYYRLHVVALRIPALRERSADIPLLVSHFLDTLARREGYTKSLSDEALDKLMRHAWPGNVRELENEIERVWVLSGDETEIGVQHLTPSIAGAREPEESLEDLVASPQGRTLPMAVEALERRMIRDGLRRAGGNKTRAAEELGISRRNLIRKVQAYGLEGAGKERPGTKDLT